MDSGRTVAGNADRHRVAVAFCGASSVFDSWMEEP